MELDTYQYRNNVENPEGTRIHVQQVRDSDPNTRRNSVASIASSITIVSESYPPNHANKEIDNYSPPPIVRLGFREGLPNLFCLQTVMLCLPYFVTFGGALIVNSVLASWYLEKFVDWDQTRAGQWSAMWVSSLVISLLVADSSTTGSDCSISLLALWVEFSVM